MALPGASQTHNAGSNKSKAIAAAEPTHDRLDGWAHLSDNRLAICFTVAVAAGAIPPHAENTKGVNVAISICRTRHSCFVFDFRVGGRPQEAWRQGLS